MTESFHPAVHRNTFHEEHLSVQWFFDRLATRFTNTHPDQDSGAIYSLAEFLRSQAVRFTTHYTPISIFLAGWAFFLAVFKLIQRKIDSQPQNGYIAVDPLVVLLVFFTWGVPIQLGIQNAYIHRLMMYYFIAFFTFAPVVGLNSLSKKIKSSSLRQLFVTVTLVAFMLISVGRSAYNLSGGSLYDLMTGIKSEPAELFTIEQLREYTCRSLQ